MLSKFFIWIVRKCVKWRQTGGCTPSGPHEKANDINCSTLIDNEWSGYCECENGRKALEKKCKDGNGGISCEKACAWLDGR